MANVDKPLAGITVVELGHSVAAPYAGLILADLGARVIKVENPKTGDYARGWGPPFWNETASVFHSLNRGKQGVTVDFGAPDDCENLRSLILDHADAVIQNLRPGILEKFGLDRGGTARREAVADLVRHRRLWRHRAARQQAGLRSARPGQHRHHECDRRGRPAAGACRRFAGRYGLRHVGRDWHARRPGRAQQGWSGTQRRDLALRDWARMDDGAARRLCGLR